MPTINELHVNGMRHAIDADSERTLLSVLRDDLDLTGTKYGCGEGACGACIVIVDDHPVRSCQSFIGAMEGKKIRTIEGLAQGDRLHPLQQAFLDADAMQCAYCTSGMIMSAAALLARVAEPKREDIIRSMSGNICRCGTYNRIVSAIEQAARAMKGGGR